MLKGRMHMGRQHRACSLRPACPMPPQVRYLARSFGIPGDHVGQTSVGMRMPFGGVSVITPFNFPIEICALQTCSALFMGNQPLCKVDWKVGIAMEQFIRMLHHVGLPKTDIDYIYCDGPVMNEIMVRGMCTCAWLYTCTCCHERDHGTRHVHMRMALHMPS